MDEPARAGSNPPERDAAAARRALKLWNVSLGDAALAAFVLCAVSGVLLVPAFDARDGVLGIAQWLLVNPGAAVLRSLHYWTAQGFLVLTVLHAWDSLRRGLERRPSRGAWLRLVAGVPVIAFLMLSGFLLRGDADALQARRILEQMLGLVPLAGPALAQLLLGQEGGATGAVFVQHAASATLVVWAVIAEHARRLWGGVRAMVLVTVVGAGLALLVSPGLHDGLFPSVRGPWYFLGLQELLHWSTWPAWLLWAGAAVLGVLVWIPAARPKAGARAKSALYAGAAAYLVLCVVVLFTRGANWGVAPGWPAGPGDLRAGALLERVTVNAAKVGLPVVLGRPEGCLACHGAMSGFSPAHKPEAVGCASCHAGDPFTLDARRAHRDMVLVPGNLADAARSCGQGPCHADVVPRVERSIMATFAGVIAVNRSVFGEDPNAGAAPGQPPHVRAVGHGGADGHLRQGCASCHLNQPKTTWGPIDENSRGGGCNACHLNYGFDAKAALDAYAPPQPESPDGRAPMPPPPSGKPFPRVHPRLSLHADGGHCFGCHSRSGRISTSYEGWHELHDDPDEKTLAAAPDRFRQLQDGRYFERRTADAHRTAGLDCVDCHTAQEVMGTGQVVARKSQALRVRCEDCHVAAGAKPASRDVRDLDPESRKILALRGWTPRPGQRVAVTRAGDALYNVTVDAEGRVTQRLKGDGRSLPVKAQAAACAGGASHARLGCRSCHTAWAPQCTTCHTSFDPASEGFDHLADRPVRGRWTERAGRFDAGPPALGLRPADGLGERGDEVVDTFVPGMIITLDRNTKAGAPSDPVFRRLFAPINAHTTQRASRSCRSCHNDPVALGYGQGALVFEPAPMAAASGTAARGGTWRFSPKEPARPQDGLPADAWTGFLSERSDRASTRDGARPFGVAEQRRILTAGACLTCHADDSEPMRAALVDFDAALKRRRPQCAAPRWDSSAAAGSGVPREPSPVGR